MLQKYGSSIFDDINLFADLMNFRYKFNDQIDTLTSDSKFSNLASFTPPMEINRSESQHTIRVELPGVKKENISVDITNSIIRITGEKKREGAVTYSKYNTINYGKFIIEHSLGTSNNPDMENVTASYVDGVLEIIIPVAVEKPPNSVSVDIV